jgi:ABC-type transporter Mla subunit MlaD
MVLRSPRAVGLTYGAEGRPEQAFGRGKHVNAIRWMAALLVLSMLLLAACGDDDPSPEEALADLCTDLTELQASVQNLTQVSTNPNATVDQLEDARDEVNEQMDAVESAAEDVDQAEVDALNEAYDNLDQAIDDIDDSATLADASASVQDEIQAVNTAWDQVLSGLQCQ